MLISEKPLLTQWAPSGILGYDSGTFLGHSNAVSWAQLSGIFSQEAMLVPPEVGGYGAKWTFHLHEWFISRRASANAAKHQLHKAVPKLEDTQQVHNSNGIRSMWS